MINLILQSENFSVGLILIETILAGLILHYIITSLANHIFEKDDLFQKKNRLMIIRGNLVAFILILSMRLILGTFGLINDPLLSFASMATIIFPLYIVFFKKSTHFTFKTPPTEKKEVEIEKNDKLNNLSNFEISLDDFNKFRKVIFSSLGLIWIICLVVFIQIFFIRREFFSIGNLVNRRTLESSSLTIFCLGIEWTLITVFFAKAITILVNSLLPIEKKVPDDVLSKSMFLSGLVSIGIWSLQLIVIELYFFGTQRGLVQDIRVLIFVVAISFTFFFIFFLKKYFMPQAIEKSELALISLLQQHEMEEKYKTKSEEKKVILDVKDLITYFYTEEGIVRAVEGVSFKIYEGEVLGLVGETGCGKSVTALSILQLVRHPGKIEGGKVLFENVDLLKKSDADIGRYRGDKITMIFQDPLNSVNPVFKVGDQISEVYLLHRQAELFKTVEEKKKKMDECQLKLDKVEIKIKVLTDKKISPSSDTKGKEHSRVEILNEEKEVLEKEISEYQKYSSIYSVARIWGQNLLKDVEIPDPEQIYDRYPYELSGGMRQRIMIAMGLACSPRLLIADEPTTALDVTIQNQILQLMKNLKKKYNTSILFITHDLGIISKMSDRVAVMYSGYIVEYGDIKILFTKPYHPYTRGLISSVPVVGKKKEELPIIKGMVPNLIYPPSGCRFHPRCDYCFEPCDSIIPKAVELEPNYYVACHLYDPQYKEERKNSEIDSNL